LDEIGVVSALPALSAVGLLDAENGKGRGQLEVGLRGLEGNNRGLLVRSRDRGDVGGRPKPPKTAP